jgi:site-specific DNA recombinase
MALRCRSVGAVHRIIHNVPELRIVQDDLWHQVKHRLAGIRDSDRVRKAREKKFWLNRRPKHLLTGLCHCGDCGAPLVAAGKDYLSCSVARRLGTCKNRKGIRRAVLEGLIVDALKRNLMHPGLVAEFVREFHSEINRQRHDAELSLGSKRRELEETRRKLDGLIEAIADGFRATGLQAKLEELERPRRRQLRGSIPILRNSIERRSLTCRTRSLILQRRRRRSKSFGALSSG